MEQALSLSGWMLLSIASLIVAGLVFLLRNKPTARSCDRRGSGQTREDTRLVDFELLSVSIDLCGSTEIKETIIALSEGQVEHRKTMYGDYLKQLFWTEQTFYELIAGDQRIQLEKLFLVKTIGDEFWYVYEVNRGYERGLSRASAALMDALLGLFRKSRQLNFASEPVADFAPEKEISHVRFEHFDPPLKGIIDLLTDGVELSLARFDHLNPRLLALAQAEEVELEARNKLAVHLYNNLNIASASLSGDQRRAVTSARTDYIGLEVDRFFRIAKFCRPSLLSVGDTLMQRLGCSIQDIPGFEHLAIKTLHQSVLQDSGTLIQRRNVIVEPLRPDQLKGVGHKYSVNHMFTLGSLHNDAFLPMTHRRDLMKPTRAFLAECGFYGIPREKLAAA